MEFFLRVLYVLALFVIVPAFIYICVKCAFVGYFSARRVYDKMQIQDNQHKTQDRTDT